MVAIKNVKSGASKNAAIVRQAQREKSSRSKRAGITFPVGRVQRFLKKGQYSERVGAGAAVYLSSVLEYLTAEILELAGNAATWQQKDSDHASTPTAGSP